MYNHGFRIEDSLIHKFIIDQEEQGKSENTILTYRRVVLAFSHWLKQQKKDIHSINQNDVQCYINTLEEEQKSPATIEKIVATLSVFARFLDKPSLVQNIRRVEKEKESQAPESMTGEELSCLLEQLKKDKHVRNIAIVYTLLHTGIRVSELCELNRDDVSFSEKTGTLRVRHVNPDKERKIPLSTPLQEFLIQYLEKREDRDDALFVSTHHQRISIRAIQHMLKKYGVYPHKLRHTFCQQLMNQGVDIALIAELAGHSDIHVTKKYSTIDSPVIQEALNKAFA